MRVGDVVSYARVKPVRDAGLERELGSRLHIPDRDCDVVLVEDVVAPCLRRSYFSLVLGHRSLSLRLRRAAAAPVVEALRSLGWGDGQVLIVNLNNCKLVTHIDAVREAEAVIVHIGRPAPPALLRATVVAALTGWRVRLVVVNPANARINVFTYECSPDQCEAVAERVREIARALHDALRSRSPPAPERGPWCMRCPYQQLCTALQKIKEVTPHV